MFYDYTINTPQGEQITFKKMNMKNMIIDVKKSLKEYYGLEDFNITRNILFNLMNEGRTKNVFLKNVLNVKKSNI
jgi:hypothetical protein